MNLLGNNIRGTLGSGINTIATAMTIVLDGNSRSYPSGVSADTPMYLTISSVTDPMLCEIVKVTATSGENVTTMERAQRGTSALVWPTGSIVSLNMHAQDVTALYPYGVYTIDSKPAPLAVTVPDNSSFVDMEFAADNDTVVLTLPTGESNLGRLLAVLVAITPDSGTATAADIVLGTIFGTESSVANGTYIYLCLATGEWAPLHALYSVTPITGVMLDAAAGAEATPSLTLGDSTTGLYRSAANEIAASVSASNIATLSSTGLDVVGAISADTLSVSGATVNTDGDIAGVDITSTGVVTAAAGTVGAPSVTLGDSTTGLYRSAAYEIATAVSGVNVVTVDTDGLEVAGRLDVEAVTATGVITATAGSAAAPALNFGTAATGLYGSATTIDFSVAGARVAGLSATALDVPAGSAAAPGINFGTAATGIYGDATSASVSISGTQRLVVGSGLTIYGDETLSSDTSTRQNVYAYRNNAAHGELIFYSARGTTAVPSALLSGDRVMQVYGRSWSTGTTFNTCGSIMLVATENHSSTAAGTKLVFYTVSNTTTTVHPALTLDNDKTMTTYANEIMASTAYKYFGASGTNGSWRIGRSGDNLVFERREAGSWVTKLTVED
jgi:hypothetical protein